METQTVYGIIETGIGIKVSGVIHNGKKTNGGYGIQIKTDHQRKELIYWSIAELQWEMGTFIRERNVRTVF